MSGVSRTYYPVAPLPDTNARIPAVTQRPASTALLTIDSEDRYTDYVAARASPTTPYNFSIAKSESLMAGFMTRIGVSEVVFPWVIPNINVKTFEMNYSYQIGATPISLGTLSLQLGFYTPAELAAAIETYFSIEPTLGFVMNYSNAEGEPYFSYYVGAGNSISFSPLPYNTTAYPFPPTTKQLFDVLGFTTANTILGSPTAAIPEIGSYTLAQSIRYVDIVCNQLTNSQAQKDQTSQTVARDMLCRIYVGGASGITSTVKANDPLFCPPGCTPTTLYRNFATPKQIQWIPNQNIPGFLQFQVYDDAGQLLDTSLVTGSPFTSASNADWSMTMLVSEN